MAASESLIGTQTVPILLMVVVRVLMVLRRRACGKLMGVGDATADTDPLRELEAVGLGLPPGLDIAWLGVSGYRLTYEGVSLFVDPYVSRVPLRSLLLRRVAMPNDAMLDRYAAAPGEVAGVLVGHTHFDHAVDAPAIARRHRAKAYG